jgi:predicted PurR-regulated permease PerM
VTGIALEIGQTLVFAVIVAALLLLDSRRLARLATGGLGSENPVFREAPAIARAAVTYFTVRIRVNLVTAVGFLVLLLVLGVDDALLWSIGAFFLSFMPYLGLVLAIIPPAILALAESGPLASLAVIVGGTVLNLVAENVLEPTLTGRALSLSTWLVFIMFFFWVWPRPDRGVAVDAHHRARGPRPPAQRADPVGGRAAHPRGRAGDEHDGGGPRQRLMDPARTSASDPGAGPVTDPNIDPRFHLPARKVLVLFAFLAAVFWFARPVLLPFIVGAIIAYAFTPAIDAAQKRTGRSRLLIVILIFGSGIAILAAIVIAFAGPVSREVGLLIRSGPDALETALRQCSAATASPSATGR